MKNFSRKRRTHSGRRIRRIYEATNRGYATETFTLDFKNDLLSWDGRNAEFLSPHGQHMLGSEVGEHRLTDNTGWEYYIDVTANDLYDIIEEELEGFAPGIGQRVNSKMPAGEYSVSGSVKVTLRGVPMEFEDDYWILEDEDWVIDSNLKIRPA